MCQGPHSTQVIHTLLVFTMGIRPGLVLGHFHVKKLMQIFCHTTLAWDGWDFLARISDAFPSGGFGSDLRLVEVKTDLDRAIRDSKSLGIVGLFPLGCRRQVSAGFVRPRCWPA